MKKLTVFTFFLMAFTYVTAQTDKGDWIVGGTLSLNTAENNTSIAVSPNAGFFILDNFLLGGKLSYEYGALGDIKISTISGGPFTRYYFHGTKARPFGEVDLDFESTTLKTSIESKTESAIGFFIGGGVALFINDNVALETIMGYKNTKVENQQGKGGFNMRIGFQVYINRLGKLVKK
jgi:opacity protein-like surface antigen